MTSPFYSRLTRSGLRSNRIHKNDSTRRTTLLLVDVLFQQCCHELAYHTANNNLFDKKFKVRLACLLVWLTVCLFVGFDAANTAECECDCVARRRLSFLESLLSHTSSYAFCHFASSIHSTTIVGPNSTIIPNSIQPSRRQTSNLTTTTHNTTALTHNTQPTTMQ